MKKTFIFGLMAATLVFTACSEDDLNGNNGASNSNQKGMVLRATVEQPGDTRATFTDKEGEEGTWLFDFTTDDKVSVTNTAISNFYTFTNEGTEFKCADAKAAESDITWYAYFPSNAVSLVGQSGTKADVANKYALAGATASATTGKGGLSITMSPKVAILVINNQIGAIDINVKSIATEWVSGLNANNDGFNVSTSTTKQTLLSATATGTYYIAVPAGVQLAVKDGDKTIKSTGTNGLQAGKYYNLTIAPATTGKAKATIGGSEVDVNWVQLWENGPKFAEYNVGAANDKAEDYGGYYCWGKTTDKDKSGVYNNGSDALTGDDDTATKLWGSNWRMPTQTELQGLLDNCDAVWTTVNDVNGSKFTGKGAYSSCSVFLPATGTFADGGVKDQGTIGNYWSSTPGSKNTKAGRLYFNSDLSTYSDPRSLRADDLARNVGTSVRAVLAK